MATSTNKDQAINFDVTPNSRKGWQRVRFDQMAESITDRIDNPSEANVEYYVGLEHLDSESLKIRRWGTPDDVEATKLRFKPGDIIFGRRRAYQRKVAVAEFEGICSAHALVLRAREETVLKDFLPFFMQSEIFFERALSISVGSLSPTINWKTLAQQEFALPPKDEQRRIADILLAADEASEQFKASLLTQKKLKETVMYELFKTSDSASHISLASVGTWISGGTPSRSRKDFWDGDIPWVSPKDMKVEVVTDTLEKVTKDGVNNGSRIVPNNSILIVVRGMILAHTFPIAITGLPIAFNQDIKALKVSQEFTPRFIYYWLQCKSKDILQLVSDSSHGTKRLPTEQLFRMQIPYFSTGKQNEVVKVLLSCDTAIKKLEKHIIHLEHVKKKLLKDFL